MLIMQCFIYFSDQTINVSAVQQQQSMGTTMQSAITKSEAALKCLPPDKDELAQDNSSCYTCVLIL